MLSPLYISNKTKTNMRAAGWKKKTLLMHENTCVHSKETYGSLRIKYNSTKIRFGPGERT